MKRDNRSRNPKHRKKTSGLTIALLGTVAALLLLIIGMMLVVVLRPKEEKPVETTTAATTETTIEATTEAETEATTEATTVPTEAPLVMLDYMAELYEENPDTVGYIWIDDTKLDYPVMYTPDDEEKYLRTSFEGNVSIAGVPFIDKDCSLDPRSDNLIIYGHNMANGTAFRTLMSYEQKSFWEKHPTFTFSTLYEEKTYEIIAAFYDRVYYKYEDVFKFYQFVDAEDEADFDEAIKNFKSKSIYDTGVTAEYGDKLVTLVTCAYHVDNGRFVVVGKEVADPVTEETTAPTEG